MSEPKQCLYARERGGRTPETQGRGLSVLGRMVLRSAAVVVAMYGSAPAFAEVNAPAVSESEARFALAGSVRDANGNAMEGVLVNVTAPDGRLVSVASDATGTFRFPPERTPPGEYDLTIRAVGYQLPDSPRALTLGASEREPLALTLEPVASKAQLAEQLTSLEWLQSWPGPDSQKDIMLRNLVNCMFCHSLERIAQTTYTADEFLPVMQRMLMYETDHSSAERIQIVAPPAPLEGLLWFGREATVIAEYLATVNKSGNRDDWSYDFKTLPRPAGKATEAVVTVYPIPRDQTVVHDLDVDAEGNVWYGNTGWDYIGMLNPQTGQFREWPAPNFLPEEPPTGTDRILGVQDVQVDGKGHVWAAVGGTKLARFLPETEKWQAFDLPVIWRNPFLSPVRQGETGLWATGITEPPQGPIRHEHAFRLDIETGEVSDGIMLFNDKPEPDDPHHIDPLNYCYMMDQDQNGDFICTAPEPSAIVRADLRSGKARLIYTPTPLAYPRRGYRDSNNQFWFGEFYADQVGVLDLHTDEIREFAMPHQFISPYYARPDEKGSVWISSTGSDRLLRLFPDTGDVVEYLMPVPYDARKVVVDTRADRITVWLPNKNAGELIRVEVPE